MPLDPNRFLVKKKSRARKAVLFAVEWSAILFTGMLAVLFVAWALALHPLPLRTVIEQADKVMGRDQQTLTFRF
jgi:hypothetical protein